MNDLDSMLADLRPRLVGRAINMGAGADAEDWAQEAVLHVWQQLLRSMADERRNPRSYYYTAGINRMRDVARTARLHSVLTTPMDDVRELASLHRVEDVVLSRLALAVAIEALNRMGTYKGVVVDRALGYKPEEIAKRHGIPTGTVKSRLVYAQKALGRAENQDACEVTPLEGEILVFLSRSPGASTQEIPVPSSAAKLRNLEKKGFTRPLRVRQRCFGTWELTELGQQQARKFERWVYRQQQVAL